MTEALVTYPHAVMAWSVSARDCSNGHRFRKVIQLLSAIVTGDHEIQPLACAGG